jgi:hypothetical protein
MVDKPADKAPKHSGYAEEQPKTNKKSAKPNARTPHEPQNVPAKKPKP